MKAKALIALAVVAAMLAVVPAIADEAVTARLYVGPAEGYYGQDCVLVPQVDVVPEPGERFEFQINNGGVWEKYEEQLVETTGTVDPMTIVFDDSIAFPAEMRTRFLKPSKDASGNAIFIERAVSESEVLSVQKHVVSKTTVTAPKTAKKGKAFTASFALKPLAGVGKVKVSVHRKVGSRWTAVRGATVTTDETSEASTSLKLSAAGTYRISAKFAGNRWAVASPVATKFVVVR